MIAAHELEDAYVVNDPAWGRLEVFGPGGKLLGTWDSWDDEAAMYAAIRADAEAAGYWPDVFLARERGDISTISGEVYR